MSMTGQSLSGEELYRIPRLGGKGVGFAGVEFSQAIIFAVSFSVGFLLMGVLGASALGIPVVGYFANKFYLDWLRDKPMGYVKTILYRKGWYSFSKAFDRPDKLFLGNATPGSGRRSFIEEEDF